MFFHGAFCASVSPLICTTAGVPPAAMWIWGSGELRVQLLGIGVPRLWPPAPALLQMDASTKCPSPESQDFGMKICGAAPGYISASACPAPSTGK